jgi:hypothetical protein
MSTTGRISIAAAASAAIVGIAFILLAAYPIPAIGRAFLAVGFPLGTLILEFAPDSAIRALAPDGGPDAVAWAIALGTLLTWFVLLFCLLYAALTLMRSNSTPHPDARASSALNQPPSARAGERGR